jgi:hypothetical protein
MHRKVPTAATANSSREGRAEQRERKAMHRKVRIIGIMFFPMACFGQAMT